VSDAQADRVSSVESSMCVGIARTADTAGQMAEPQPHNMGTKTSLADLPSEQNGLLGAHAFDNVRRMGGKKTSDPSRRRKMLQIVQRLYHTRFQCAPSE